MQAILSIPGLEALRKRGEAADVLTSSVAGVPLLVRVIATAARAGVNSVLLVLPAEVDRAVLDSFKSPLLKTTQICPVIRNGAFNASDATHWASIATNLNGEFLWLPWNFVTSKRALSGLRPSAIAPATWDLPVRLKKSALAGELTPRQNQTGEVDGLSIRSLTDVSEAERFLVANSGKPTDGIYSNFNRRLCRPPVRLLSHTSTTPNAITVAGLAIALVGALLFARGSYLNDVAGALCFFLSGLFDEMDGMIARIKFRESAFGTWFEGFVDNATYLAVFAGIVVGLQRTFGKQALECGVALLVGSVLSIVTIAAQRRLATRPDRPHEYAGRMHRLMDADSSNLVSKVVRQLHIFVKKGVLIHYLLIFTLLGQLRVFLWLAALGSNITWIVSLYFTRRFFYRPPGKHMRAITQE